MGPRARARGNPPCYLRATDHSSLQWGHERALVEIQGVAPCISARLRLQWGHERALVEIPTDHSHRVSRPSFNGATSARSWKSQRLLQSPRIPRALQWGHERALVEIRSSRSEE